MKIEEFRLMLDSICSLSVDLGIISCNEPSAGNIPILDKKIGDLKKEIESLLHFDDDIKVKNIEFIDVNGDLINLAHIIKIDLPPCEPFGNGDWAMTFHLSNGTEAYDYEVSYQALYARYEEIKKMLGIE